MGLDWVFLSASLWVLWKDWTMGEYWERSTGRGLETRLDVVWDVASGVSSASVSAFELVCHSVYW